MSKHQNYREQKDTANNRVALNHYMKLVHMIFGQLNFKVLFLFNARVSLDFGKCFIWLVYFGPSVKL